MPAVRPGKPEKAEQFTMVDLYGMEFYISRSLQEKQILIDWGGWWIFSNLVVTVS